MRLTSNIHRIVDGACFGQWMTAGNGPSILILRGVHRAMFRRLSHGRILTTFLVIGKLSIYIKL